MIFCISKKIEFETTFLGGEILFLEIKTEYLTDLKHFDT